MISILIYISSMKSSGGIERVITNLMKQWVDSYQIILCTKDNGDSFYEIPSEITLLSINNELNMDMNNRLKRMISVFTNSIISRKKIKKLLEEISPDYIYTTTPMDAAEIYFAGKVWRKRLVASEHGSSSGYNKIYNMLKKYIYPRIYCVSVPNKMDTEIYKKWGANAIFVPHIVTFKAERRNELNNKVLLNIGRLTADKQQEQLIRIWKNISDKNGWVLYIVGDGEEKDHLRNLIEELNVGDSAFLFPARKSVVELYNQASVFVLTSRFEGFGMVLLEAMAFGIPCVSFDCPSGPRDIIDNGINGYLVENGNFIQYGEYINSIIHLDHNELLELGKGAFKTVKDWDNTEIMKKWNNIFVKENN